MIVGLISGFRSLLKLLRGIRFFLVETFSHKESLKIMVEFFTEAGVLILVFPTLDTVINKGESKVTGGLVFLSFVIAFLCLLVASRISRRVKEEDRRY